MNCKACRWFKPDDNPNISLGCCRLVAVFPNGAPHYGEALAIPMPVDRVPPRMPGLTMAVFPDFGCVQFKKAG